MADTKSTLPDRFWSKVEKLPCEPGCWLWSSALHSGGYGVLNVGGAALYAHRLAFADANGLAYEATEHVHHKCHVRSCVNPDHLQAMTFEEHMAHHADERSETCQRGHSMADAYKRPDGTARMCRECVRLRNIATWQRLKVAKPPIAERPCIQCRKPFVPIRTRTTRYCGAKCRMAAFKERHA